MDSPPACATRKHCREHEISLPAQLQAHAFLLRGERQNYWEKSLVVTFPERRQTLSTYDGLVDAFAAVNHSAHPHLWKAVGQKFMGRDGCGGKTYVEHIRRELAADLGLDHAAITKVATAVDVDNVAVVTQVFTPITVTVLVTAGVETNALRAGTDVGTFIEGQEPPGTINIILLTNAVLSVGAMARAIVTATEAKTAALQDRDIPSCYTPDAQATGTGTDSVIVVSGSDGPAVTYTGGHSRIGGMIGQAVHEGVLAALAKHQAAEMARALHLPELA